MNLNYDLTQEALQELIATADRTITSHNIALDFDGEIIIDPEKHYPNVDIRRYKFCTHVKDASLRSKEMVEALYRSLVAMFQDEQLYIGNRGDMNIAA